MSKDPAFPFYASDWLGSNTRAMMSLEQQGAYFTLLCRQWTDPTCSLPDDDDVLARLSGLNKGWFTDGSQIVRDCFEPHPTLNGRIANRRLLDVRAERDDWSDKSRQGGQKSGVVRRVKAAARKASVATKGGSTTVGSKGATKHEPNVNTPSSSSSPSPSLLNSSCPKFHFDEADMETADWMSYLIKKLDPSARKPNFSSWANDVRLMRERDKRTDEQIRAVFEWANQDEFWSGNILCPAKLRVKFTQLLTKMKSGPVERNEIPMPDLSQPRKRHDQ